MGMRAREGGRERRERGGGWERDLPGYPPLRCPLGCRSAYQPAFTLSEHEARELGASQPKGRVGSYTSHHSVGGKG